MGAHINSDALAIVASGVCDASFQGQPSFDQTKLWGNGQQAPLTPEYQAMLDASIADQEKGGLGNNAEHVLCQRRWDAVHDDRVHADGGVR